MVPFSGDGGQFSILFGSKVPKSLWTYAAMTAVYTRNRCYSQRTKNTPYYLMAVRQPSVNSLLVFENHLLHIAQEY